MSGPGSGTKWQPSPDQERLLSVFQDANYDISVCDACANADVPRKNYYNWHGNPEFGRWWQDQAEGHFRLQLHRVQAATFAHALGGGPRGSAQSAKLYLERFDKNYCPASRQHQEHSGSIGVALDMSGMEPDEIERLAHAVNDDPPADSGLPDSANGADTAPGEVGTSAP
jgi:hypothetical protein